jgi:hypothetical protein
MWKRLATLAALLLVTPCSLRATEKPRLVILVVFDQMRGDYVKKWRPLFSQEGFIRMQTEGAWFDNCHYPYGVTTTGPGHASLLTGTCPDTHGIINNSWYEAKSGATVNCATSARYTRVPPLMIKTDPAKDDAETKESKKSIGNPDRVLAPTVGDALRLAYGDKSKIVGLSFKDRSALFPVGKNPNGAYWVDSTDGMVITSTYYRDAVAPWVKDFNEKRVINRWFDKEWNRLLPDVDYVAYSGPDEVETEGKGSKQGGVFPHPMNGGKTEITKSYYDALYNSPFGNEFLFELTKSAVEGENLGQDDIPDLLTVSFSCTDSVGHCWGPDSQEVLDVNLRADRLMADFMKYFDEKVGKGKYLICLSADHGICSLPEVSASKGLDAKRLSNKKYHAEAEKFLQTKFGGNEVVDSKTKLKWIEQTSLPWFYLNRKLIESKGLDVKVVAKSLAGFLNRVEGVQRVFTREDLERDQDPYDFFGQRMQRSYFPERSGDLAIMLKPYWLPGEEKATGTTHGSPHPYDTHVPLLVFGTGVNPGTRHEPVTPQAIASIFSQALGIKPPAKAEFPVPDKLFRSSPSSVPSAQ